MADRELVISGEFKERERTGMLRRGTRRTGQFEYRTVLPSEINAEGVDAKLSEGVVSIKVPKAEAAKRPATSRSRPARRPTPLPRRGARVGRG
jgi:HSP20 family protein